MNSSVFSSQHDIGDYSHSPDQRIVNSNQILDVSLTDPLMASSSVLPTYSCFNCCGRCGILLSGPLTAVSGQSILRDSFQQQLLSLSQKKKVLIKTDPRFQIAHSTGAIVFELLIGLFGESPNRNAPEPVQPTRLLFPPQNVNSHNGTSDIATPPDATRVKMDTPMSMVNHNTAQSTLDTLNTESTAQSSPNVLVHVTHQLPIVNYAFLTTSVSTPASMSSLLVNKFPFNNASSSPCPEQQRMISLSPVPTLQRNTLELRATARTFLCFKKHVPESNNVWFITPVSYEPPARPLPPKPGGIALFDLIMPTNQLQ
jgi:hypothetical protein